MNKYLLITLITISIVLIVSLALGLGLGLGLKSNSVVPSLETSLMASDQPTQSLEPFGNIETEGSMYIIYDKIMYDTVSTPSNAMNFLRSIVNKNINSDTKSNFVVCFPNNLNVVFSDEMVLKIAEILNIRQDCVLTPSTNLSIHTSGCIADQTSIILDSERVVASVMFPVNNQVSDLKLKEIIYELNIPDNYILMCISKYIKSDSGHIIMLFYILDISDSNFTKVSYIDDMNSFNNVVYGGSKQAVELYKQKCN